MIRAVYCLLQSLRCSRSSVESWALIERVMMSDGEDVVDDDVSKQQARKLEGICSPFMLFRHSANPFSDLIIVHSFPHSPVTNV